MAATALLDSQNAEVSLVGRIGTEDADDAPSGLHALANGPQDVAVEGAKRCHAWQSAELPRSESSRRLGRLRPLAP